jgi:hypothetical protein
MTTPNQELDLDLIERTLAAFRRVPRFPALFEDMRALVAEVKRLRAENERLLVENSRLHDVALEYQDMLDEVG